MKLPRAGIATGPGWEWRAGEGAQKDFWRLADTRRSRELCRLGGAMLNHLPEAGAVCAKFRRHGRGDGSAVELEMISGYPFGGEARIERRIVLRDGFADVCADVRPGRGEAVRSLEAEVLRFPGGWQSLEIVPDAPPEGCAPGELLSLTLSDKPGAVLWEGERPPMLMLLSDCDGLSLEVGAGDDWWRMAEPGAGCARHCSIERDDEGVLCFRRRLLEWDDGAELERRPWRYRYYLAWGDGRKREALGDFQEVALPELPVPPEGRCGNVGTAAVCWQSPAARKVLRKWLRREAAGEDRRHLSLQIAPPAMCGNAAHLERPQRGTLPHWQLSEMADFHDWAGRQLGGRAFRMAFPAGSIWERLPSGRYLWNTPVGKVGFPEE